MSRASRYMGGLASAAALAITPAMIAAPAQAQDAAVEQPPVSAERLAAAKVAIGYLFPPGTYERIMRGTMDQMMDRMFQQMFDLPVSDFTKPADGKGPEKSETMREAAIAEDPHFEERFSITMKVMTQEMIALMNEIEPEMIDALVRTYARKYDTEQLVEMNAFFATPTGGLFARDIMTAFMDPEMMAAMQSFVPQIVKAMPAMMTKVQSATAHLPPPPKKTQEQ